MPQVNKNQERQLSTRELRKILNEACRTKPTNWQDPYFLACIMSFGLLVIHFLALCVMHAYLKTISQTYVLGYLLYTLWTMGTFLLWIVRETYQEVRRFIKEGAISMSDVICAGLAKVTMEVTETTTLEQRTKFLRSRKLELTVLEARSKVIGITIGVLVSLLQVLMSDAAYKSYVVSKLHLALVDSCLLVVLTSMLLSNLKRRVEQLRLISAVDASLSNQQSTEKTAD